MKLWKPVLQFRSAWAMALLPAAVAAPLSAECTTDHSEGNPWFRDSWSFELRLPDGEESAECRLDLDRPPDWLGLFPGLAVEDEPESNDDGVEDDDPDTEPPPGPPSRWRFHENRLDLAVHASGTVEVEVRYVGSALDHFPGVLQLRFREGELTGFSGSYADVTVDPGPKRYSFDLALLADRLRANLVARAEIEQFTEADLDALWDSPELVMTVRRIRQSCWMAAWVTGDVPEPRRFDGDVAWFRTSDVKVKEGMMVGTLADADLAETFSSEPIMSADDALALAERLGIPTHGGAGTAGGGEEQDGEDQEQDGEDQDQDGPEDSEVEPGTFAEWLREETAAGEDEDGDNFGLNLVALDLDANPGTDAAATAMLTSAFTLALSGKVWAYGPDEDTGGARIDFRTSLVQATVGLGDDGGGRIPFGLGSLQGWFSTTEKSGDFIVGFLVGELESDGKYSLGGVVPHGTGTIAAEAPRTLKIGVVAKFAARRGAFSCTGP